jgi:WD40 repeat protein
MRSYRETYRRGPKIIGLEIACALIAAGTAIAIDAAIECPVMAASTPDYSTNIAPILKKNCLICHSKGAHKSDFVLDTYENLMKGGKHGAAVVPHDANGSRLLAMLEGKVTPRMPIDDDPLPAADIAAIKAWIEAGAPGPSASETTTMRTLPPTPTIRPEVAVVSPVASLRFSPDGRVLAAGGYGEVRLLDSSSGKVLAALPGETHYVRSIAFSPDGKMLAAAGGMPQIEGEIKIWDVDSHQLVKTIRGHSDCIYSVAWSPDGKLIASGSYDRMVKLWDAATGKEVHNLQDHIDAVFAVAFSPDGKRLASASQDRSVKIWDVASGKRLYTLSDASDGLTSVAYSPAGDQVAAAGYDKTIYVWRLSDADGHLAQSLIADQDTLLALVWSPDGKTIISSSSDGSIRLRDTKLDLTGVIDRQPDWVEALDMSPDGKRLAAGRYNGSLSLYDVKTLQETTGKVTVFDALSPAGGAKGGEAASR